mgnify:CR=1 FL=1
MRKEDFVFGIRPVIEAIKAGKEIEKILVQQGTKGPLMSELQGFLKSRSIPFQYVPRAKLNQFTRANHQGVIALVSPVPFQPIEQIIPALFETGKDPFIVILDQISDVRNFGAIARTANCAGVDAIIIPTKGSARINSFAQKASAGALNLIPIHRTENLPSTIRFLKESGLQIIAATEKADQVYYEASFEKPMALILGAEEKGIPSEHLKLADAMIKIPIIGQIESLNVSVAAGIIIFEALKQRTVRKK